MELGARTLSFLSAAGALTVAGHSIPWVSVIVEGSYALLLFVAWNYWRHGQGGGRSGLAAAWR